ncbi:probable ATP-dependent RNA helicase kurz [Bactrocera neohumeralis]|uniref:probable ATP-dependent RNA helicase kurz n=1 Tax=Bactrocera neohumeralis TaxID=98809 RepID=UPI00216638AB|nr:probable ATP-dependent RNA helicase kurz [Bactrocera neohumeralis]
MGKKVFNAKARQNHKTLVDNSAVKDIKIEWAEGTAEAGAGYDDANALALPSQKRATKVQLDKQQHVKILTKKQRKHLQQIVDKKKKKEGRAELLQALASVQVPEQELKQYTSISQVQTVGVKKLQTLEEVLAKKQQRQTEQSSSKAVGKISAIKGAAKRKLLIEDEEALAAKRRDPNVVSLEENEDSESHSESESESESDIEMAEKPNNKIVKEKVEDSKIKTEDPEDKPSTSTKTTDKKSAKANIAAKPKKPEVPMRTTVYVHVHRDAEVQAARLKLPILGEEQEIMETINENQIIIVAGETGSGKTTQIPQFLYEAGYAQNNKIIGITEPRRVAAIAMSKRVAREMNLNEQEVSYLIRFEGNVTPQTRIKFMTDGVLLKEVESDFLLRRYSVIILDEAHERSAYTDILVGLLSRIVPLRQKRGDPLKLIIMSATLRVDDFIGNPKLFKYPPPVLKVEARQFPVTVHFQRRTPTDYLQEAFKKIAKIHSQLPDGGILVFLTGQQEVNTLVRKLRRTFPYIKKDNEKGAEKDGKNGEHLKKTVGKDDDKAVNSTDNSSEPKEEAEKMDEAIEDTTELVSARNDDDSDIEFDMKRAIRSVKKSKKKFMSQIALPKINLDDYKLPGDDTEADLHEAQNSESEAEIGSDNTDEDDADGDENTDAHIAATKQPLWVLPLYSLLSPEKQNRIFQPPPEGCRLCIVSTNVAETSLTIPNIKYVVDSGRQKTRLYDKITGVSAFVVTYTSKASADQRAGRAGRVSAGHCYRLYSSAVYNHDFMDFSQPDIQKRPVDDLMLQMRCMGIDRVVNFPFPSPPDTVQLQAAEQRLVVLGALERMEPLKEGKELPPAVTKLGQVISRFPVAPRFGKMLALSHQQQLLPYTVCLVAALSVQELLLEVGVSEHAEDGDDGNTFARNKWQKKRISWAATGNYQLLGDPMVLLRAVGAAEYAGSQGKLSQFCAENGLRPKALTEVRKLRVQLTNEINLNVTGVDLCVDPSMAPPTDGQARFLRQILLAGMADRVARKVPLTDVSDKEEKRRLKFAYNCADMVEPVFMHSSSVLRTKLPEWVVYQEAYETQHGDGTKMYMRGITAIEPEWLLLYAPLLCNIRDIKEEPMPRYKETDGKVYCFVDATFGKAGWELPLIEVEMPAGEKAYSYFGVFLLDGQVCPALAAYKAKLKATPPSLVKSWSNLNESVVRFKRALNNKQINTREKLQAEWARNPNFLLEEYQNMLYDVSIAELSPKWPPLEG